MITCYWCGKEEAVNSVNTVYWELPDGTRCIHVTQTPSVKCHACGMEYQTDEITKEIEDHLFIINTAELEQQLSYTELMAKPKLLKRNYFDFRT